MKKAKKTLAFLFAMILCICMMTINVSAASTEQDGLEVSLTTDKSEYSQGDPITATLAVTNTNDVAVSNVSLENMIPEGYSLAEGSEAEKQVESLDAGETVTMSVPYIADVSTEGDDTEDTGKPSGGNINNDGSDSGTGNADKNGNGTTGSNNGSNNNSTGKGNSQSTGTNVKTGDKTNVALWVAVAVIAGAVIIVALVVKKKKSGKRFLSLFLCLTMAGALVPLSQIKVEANELGSNKEIYITNTVLVSNESLDIDAKVTYQIETSEPEHSDIYLYASQYILLADNVNSEKEVYFYAEYEGNSPSLDLVDTSTGKVLTSLLDDGNVKVDGDEIAGDNLYSGIFSLDITDIYTVSIVAQTGNSKSNTIKLDVIDDFTDEEYEAAQYITSTVNNLVSSGEYDTASKEEKVRLAISKLQELAEIEINGDLNYVLKESISYDENTDIVYYTDFMGGFRGIDVSDPNEEDYYLAGNTNLSSENTSNEKSNILSAKSGLNSNSLTSDMKRGIIVYGWSLNINHGSGYFDFYSNLCQDVEENGMEMNIIQGDVQSLKTILNDQDFVGLACHGANYTLYGIETTILEIPELTNSAKDKAYAQDINNQNVIQLVRPNDFDPESQEKYYVTGKFFETYYGNNGYGSDTLNDTIIYLGSCHGFGDDGNIRNNLANSFLFSGAECVLGHVNEVNVSYDINIMNEIILNLIDGEDVQEALYQAELKYGEDDVEYWERYTGKTTDKVRAYNEIAFFEQETFPYWEEYKKTSIFGNITGNWNEDDILTLNDVNVTLEKNGKIYRSTITDESGNYTFSSIAPGSYIIKYEKQDYETITEEVSVIFGNITEKDVGMNYEGKTGISGCVVDSEGNILSDANVVIKDSTSGKIITSALTHEGVFLFELQNGEYDIEISKENYKTTTINKIIICNNLYNLSNVIMYELNSSETVSIKQIANNGCSFAAVTETGELWTWGSNSLGELGNGTNEATTFSPKKVLDNVIYIHMDGRGSSNSNAMAAITEDGSLWTWGYNVNGQLGNGTTENINKPQKILDNVKDVRLSRGFGVAISQNNDLWVWGEDAHLDGLIGNNSYDKYSPIKVLENVKSVEIDSESGALIMEDDSLWTWGENRNGRLGIGSTNDVINKPTKVMDNVRQVSITRKGGLAITKDDTLWTWGQNEYGQLGDGTTESRLSPVKIMDNVRYADMNNWNSSCCAIQKDGSLWTWGQNIMGFLGNGTSSVTLSPVQVMSNVKSIDFVGYHVCAAVTENGELWTWGNNGCGALGCGDDKPRYSLSPIKIMDNVEIAYSRGLTGIAIKDDGSLWTWGSNSLGELGIGVGANEVDESYNPIDITYQFVLN